jgi:hypothetical protein
MCPRLLPLKMKMACATLEGTVEPIMAIAAFCQKTRQITLTEKSHLLKFLKMDKGSLS